MTMWQVLHKVSEYNRKHDKCETERYEVCGQKKDAKLIRNMKGVQLLLLLLLLPSPPPFSPPRPPPLFPPSS